MTVLVEYMVVDAVIGDPDDRFFDRLSAALQDLAKQGTALEVIERDEKPSQIRLSWLDHRSGSAVRIWDDYRAMVRYLELRAPDSEMMSRLRTTLEQHLAPPKRADLVSLARRAPTDLAALMRVVYSAEDSPDAETVSIVASALDHESPAVRAMASYGAGILGWPELKRAVEQRRAIESDVTVMDSLQRSLALME